MREFRSVAMKEILIRLLIAAFLTFAAFALSSSARGQRVDAGVYPVDHTTKHQKPSQESQPSPEYETSTVTSAFSEDSDQTQDAFVFAGQITQQKGMWVLTDPITRVIYQLDDQERARRFADRYVHVVGKLGIRTNTIRVETITLRR